MKELLCLAICLNMLPIGAWAGEPPLELHPTTASTATGTSGAGLLSSSSEARIKAGLNALFRNFEYRASTGDSALPTNPALVMTATTGESVASWEPATSPLSGENLQDFASALFDEIALLPTAQYNQMLTFLAMEYAEAWENIPKQIAIDSVFDAYMVRSSSDASADALRQRLQRNVAEAKERHPVLDVLGGIVSSFVLVDGFARGKGVINTYRLNPEGLAGMKRFRAVTRAFFQRAPFSKRTRLLTLGAGSTYGLGEVLYHYLATHRLEPTALIAETRVAMIDQFCARAGVLREDMAALKAQKIEELVRESKEVLKHLAAIDREQSNLQSELDYLKRLAPEKTGLINEAIKDLMEVSNQVLSINQMLYQIANEFEDPTIELPALNAPAMP